MNRKAQGLKDNLKTSFDLTLESIWGPKMISLNLVGTTVHYTSPNNRQRDTCGNRDNNHLNDL